MWFAAFSVVVFLIAARVLVHEFRALNWSAVATAVHQWRQRFQLAVLLCGLSFAAVGLIEWRALRWAGTRIPPGEAFTVSFIANGFAHGLGASALVASAVRARLYARHGVGLTMLLIPRHRGQPFHAMVGTDSTASWAPLD